MRHPFSCILERHLRLVVTRQVLVELGAEYSSQELASFMTISKGYMGECGLRGGWVELVNMLPEVQAQLYKCMSAMLCPSVLGQAVVDCVAKPPAPGEPSYDLWIKEKTDILTSLKDRAKLIAETFNTFEGFKCNVVQVREYIALCERVRSVYIIFCNARVSRARCTPSPGSRFPRRRSRQPRRRTWRRTCSMPSDCWRRQVRRSI